MSFKDFFSRKSLKGDSHIYTYPVYSQEFSSFTKFNDYGRSKLDDYWKAYIDYGIVFASIETIAVNTVMTGYTIHSDNEEAKKAVEEFLHNSKLIEKRILPNIRFTLIFGDSISEKYYNEDGYFTDLLLRDPRSFDMIFDKYGMITGYLQKHGVFSSKSKEVIIPPEKIVHFQFFSRPDSPWGISLIAPSYETIVRKNSVDEATATAVIRHGHPKYVITILGVKDSMQKRIPDDEYQKIRRNLTNLDAKKEILIPDTIKIDNIDIKGVQHVEEYFNYFTQLLTAGLMVPEEAVGLGRNITEACYSADTETLTKRGWLKLSEIREDDEVLRYDIKTGKLNWVKPNGIISYRHTGKMIHIKSRLVDMLVTPNHRIYAMKYPYHRGTKKEWKIVEARELLHGEWAIKVSANDYIGEINFNDTEKNLVSKYTLDGFLKLLGLFLSDGSLRPSAKNYTVSISQKKKKYLDIFRKTLLNLGFKEYNFGDHGFEWSKTDRELYRYLEQLGAYDSERHLSETLKNLPPKYLDILIKYLSYGDGYNSENRYEISTTSKQLADDLMEIGIKAGYFVSMNSHLDKRGNRKRLYRVILRKKKHNFTLITSKRNVREVDYDDYVYSVDLNGGFYVTRRNGKIALQGNTSKTKIVMFERFIASIQRYVESKIENEIIPEILENYGIDRNTRVYIRFRGITEKDEAVKARWLSSILNAFPDKKPFTINEVRAMFGFPPIEGGDEL